MQFVAKVELIFRTMPAASGIVIGEATLPAKSKSALPPLSRGVAGIGMWLVSLATSRVVAAVAD
jgi:hypothetical protein